MTVDVLIPLSVLGSALVTGFAVRIVLNVPGSQKRIERSVARLHGTPDPDFCRAMGILLGPSVVGGNAVRVLQDGHEISRRSWKRTPRCKVSMTFETFTYWSGGVGRAFAEALSDRARSGSRCTSCWTGSARARPRVLCSTRCRRPGRGSTAAGPPGRRRRPAHPVADPVVSGLAIDVETRDGVVSLAGKVSGGAERARAIELARGVEGVRSVTDDLAAMDRARWLQTERCPGQAAAVRRPN